MAGECTSRSTAISKISLLVRMGRHPHWHRPLSAYMTAFLQSGLMLAFFSEPAPVSGELERQEAFRRVPWFIVMEWTRPEVA